MDLAYHAGLIRAGSLDSSPMCFISWAAMYLGLTFAYTPCVLLRLF